MGSGKRASMREGPLANLFRKTETDGLEPPRAEEPRPERATPTPQERLRHAFSSEVPGDMMAPPDDEVPPPGPPTTSGPRCPTSASARRSCGSSASAAAA